MFSDFTSVLLTLWIEPISCFVFPEIEFQYRWASIVTPFCKLILSRLRVREFKLVFPPSTSNKRMFSLRFSYWMICSSMFWILVSSFYCDLKKGFLFSLLAWGQHVKELWKINAWLQYSLTVLPNLSYDYFFCASVISTWNIWIYMTPSQYRWISQAVTVKSLWTEYLTPEEANLDAIIIG